MITLQWIASIWCQNDQKRWGTSLNIQSYAKLQKKSNYNELHRFDIKTIKNVELRRKTFKTTQIYKTDQITMNFNRFNVKTIKTFELGRKTTKVIKLQWIASIWRQNDQNFWVTSLNYKVIKLQLIASIWCQNDQECWVTSLNIQNYAKLQKKSNYNELHRFDVKNIKPTQNY